VFNETKSVSQKLFNRGAGENAVIEFVKPCPRVEWAGELKRDRHFVINTNSDDEDNLLVTVFNPNHGEDSFQDMTNDRLEKVLLFYRELGDLHWSTARTEVEGDDGKPTSVEVDFAANYAVESSYGYTSMKWKLANFVSEGTYEIKVEAKCDQLGGPPDIDMSSTSILSGVIDLTLPEQYGQALPLRDTVLLGEELVAVFTEPLRCEKPFTFDLRVIIEDTNYRFDREELQVVCEGRKVGFQIDPTVGIDVEQVMGKTFTVEIGKVGVDSLSNIFDANGNAIENNVKFSKTLANINLDEALSSFTFTLEDIDCSDDIIGALADEVKEKIMLLLELDASDNNRIVLTPLRCKNGNTVTTTVTLLPPSTDSGGGRSLRAASLSASTDGIKAPHSISLFNKLRDISQEEQRKRSLLSTPEGREMFADEENSGNDRIGFPFRVKDLKIIPSASDTKAMLTTGSDLLDLEEDLFRIASSSKIGDQSKEMILKKVDRRAIVDEIELHEDAMVAEIREEGRQREKLMLSQMKTEIEELMLNQMKTLHIELLVVTLACIGISFVALLHLNR